MSEYTFHHDLLAALRSRKPQASAEITGNSDFPDLKGTVAFYPAPYKGVIVEAELYHLPYSMEGNPYAFFGFHIHEHGDCSDAFQNTGGHYNPENAAHPFHAGDMPPLMSNKGYAWMAFFDERFTISEIIDKSVVIHRMPDDFTTQPAGDAGEKIGCGVIRNHKSV